MRIRLGWTVSGAALLAGCLNDRGVVNPGPPPVINAASVAANPQNVLSAVVTARVRDADSVMVRYGIGINLDSVTPAAPLVGDSAVLPVLGLLSATAYSLRVVAFGNGQTGESGVLTINTGLLPADLPSYTTRGTSPSPGFVAFSAGRYGIVIDNSGRVVWYHAFPQGPGLNFQAQPTGRYVARPPLPINGVWVEVDPLGQATRSFGCTRSLVSRFHDVIVEPDGAYWVMCDETRTQDLTAVGGLASAQVMGTVVQHVSATGVLLFEWSPFDHFAITDLAAADRAGTSVNWTHGNALDLDTDGNLLVSFRSLNEITKIDTRTGAVLWRMGGLRNQFTFEDPPGAGAGFARQHGLRVTGPGRIELLDNLGDPAGSRAERYAYDAVEHSARLLGSYGPDPAVTAMLGGTTQNLPGGRTLVAFGNGGRVQEYDASGAVVWEIEGNAGYIFRAQRIWSLYAPGVGSPR